MTAVESDALKLKILLSENVKTLTGDRTRGSGFLRRLLGLHLFCHCLLDP